MKIMSRFKETGIETDIAILKQVLCSAHIEYKPARDFWTYEEYRTYLISQLTHVPLLINSLFDSQPATIASNEEYLKRELERERKKSEHFEKRLYEVQMKENEDYKRFEDTIKALGEENEFLRDSKEKVYILREGWER